MKKRKTVILLVLSIVIALNLLTITTAAQNETLSTLLVKNRGCFVQDKYLIGLSENTSISMIDSIFDQSESISIQTVENRLRTGDKVNLIRGNKVVDILEVVILGDLDGNGVINSADYLKLKRSFMGSYVLEGAYLRASEVSDSGTLTSRDYIMIKRHFLKSYNIYNGGYMDINDLKVAYIPLDDRPVNLDRVFYTAISAGYNILIPPVDLFATKLDGNGTNSNGTKYGNREALLGWLKEREEDCDFFIISLDQILSGGLVNSRVQNNADLSLEYEIIDYLIDLNKKKTVYFFDTVIRLASTVNYNGYGIEQYNLLRQYGNIARKLLTGNSLTVENIFNGYKFSESGVKIQMTLPESEVDDYLAARYRKLKLIDYFFTSGGNELNYCYVGVDDSSPNKTIQTNEINYINKLIDGNGILFAGCDELALMCLTRLTSDVYKKNLKVSLKYFGGGENSPADSFDIETLKENLEGHLISANVDIASTSKAGAEILTLTRPIGNSLSYYSDKLLDTLESNLISNIPTIVIDASTQPGTLQLKMMERNLPLASLLGYSNWNTVGNSIGIAVSQGLCRLLYLENSIRITDESTRGFVKGLTFSYIKDISYKLSSTDISDKDIMSLINNSEAITATKFYKTEKVGVVSVTNYRQPWNRSFEITFDINIH